MTEFSQSRWAQSSEKENYKAHTDYFIPEQQQLYGLVRSYFQTVVKQPQCRVLDLGSGDGNLSHALWQADRTVSLVLVDGSASMLHQAHQRLGHLVDTKVLSFQDLMRLQPDLGQFDFICSCLAVHHLTLPEKKALFYYCWQALKPGGHLAMVDVVKAASPELEAWYLQLWQANIHKAGEQAGQENGFVAVVQGYKNNPDNRPDTLNTQLEALIQTGFRHVEVHYKHGIFAFFSGCKPNYRVYCPEAEDMFPLGAYDPGS